MNKHNIITYFKEWILYVNEYINQLEPDNILLFQNYIDEYFEDVIVDEDSKTHSFPLPIQLKIDKLCTDTIKLLNSYVEENKLTESKKDEIEAIIESVQDLKDKQTEITKGEVIKKLANIWASVRKAGIKIFTEVKAQALKEVVQQAVKGLLNNPSDLVDFAKGIIE